MARRRVPCLKIRRGGFGPLRAFILTMALACAGMMGLASPARAAVDDPNAKIPLAGGDLAMPSSSYQDCATPKDRAYYVDMWVRQNDPELARRAERFHMPVNRYAAVVNDWMCWLIWDGTPQGKRLVARMRYGIYDRIECDVDWDEHCALSRKLTVPAGWQVCRLLYRIDNNRGDTRLIFRPTDWLSSGYGLIGFRSYDMTFRADGKGAIFDKIGAHLTVRDVGIDAVSDTLTVAERRERGCDVPEHRPPPPPDPPKPGPVPPLPNEVQQIAGATTERYRVIMRNPGQVANATYYEMWVYDPFWGKEMLFQSEVVTLAPGGVWDYEFHKYGAQRWRFQSRLVQ